MFWRSNQLWLKTHHYFSLNVVGLVGSKFLKLTTIIEPLQEIIQIFFIPILSSCEWPRIICKPQLTIAFIVFGTALIICGLTRVTWCFLRGDHRLAETSLIVRQWPTQFSITWGIWSFLKHTDMAFYWLQEYICGIKCSHFQAFHLHLSFLNYRFYFPR